jgi:hypothetical protein
VKFPVSDWLRRCVPGQGRQRVATVVDVGKQEQERLPDECAAGAAQQGGEGRDALGEEQRAARRSAGRSSQLANPSRRSPSPVGQRIRW